MFINLFYFRKDCIRCRYDKCIKIGMKTIFVQSRNYAKKRLEHQNQPMTYQRTQSKAFSSTLEQSKAFSSTQEQSKTFLSSLEQSKVSSTLELSKAQNPKDAAGLGSTSQNDLDKPGRTERRQASVFSRVSVIKENKTAVPLLAGNIKKRGLSSSHQQHKTRVFRNVTSATSFNQVPFVIENRTKILSKLRRPSFKDVSACDPALEGEDEFKNECRSLAPTSVISSHPLYNHKKFDKTKREVKNSVICFNYLKAIA